MASHKAEQSAHNHKLDGSNLANAFKGENIKKIFELG
jgi:hypothetical protein